MCMIELDSLRSINPPRWATRYKIVRKKMVHGHPYYSPLVYKAKAVPVGGGWEIASRSDGRHIFDVTLLGQIYTAGVHCYVSLDNAVKFLQAYGSVRGIALVKVRASGFLASGIESLHLGETKWVTDRLEVDVWKRIKILEEINIPEVLRKRRRAKPSSAPGLGKSAKKDDGDVLCACGHPASDHIDYVGCMHADDNDFFCACGKFEPSAS